MSTANVINFNLNETLNQEKRRISVPELLTSSKRIADKRLQALMNTMFNNADDCLFEYADKAANNEQQTTYMDAMRELRIKKTKMQQAFFSDFNQQFSDLLNNTSPSGGFKSNQPPPGAGLSLLEEDVLEESLAITNMASRVFSEFREPLSAMVLRMNEVSPETQFSKETNPLSPTLICNAFSQSLDCLTVRLEIKLIVYKLFDKFVVRNMGQLYHEINEMFVAAGVLPTIKYKMPVTKPSDRSASKTAADSDTTSATQPQPAVNIPSAAPSNGLAGGNTQNTVPGNVPGYIPGNVFESMRQALYQYRGEPNPAGYSGSVAGVTGGGEIPHNEEYGSSDSGTAGPIAEHPGGSGVYYVTSDIISGLSSIQNNTAIAAFHGGTKNSGEVIKTKVLQAVVKTQGDDEDKPLNNTDADVIDIVSMMFDYILNDRSLPARTKAVIARLQIPMVKVAILDKTFFNKKTHPARALLNELAYASNVLDSEYDDTETLYDEVERIVTRVLNEFDSNVELFSELLSEFVEFLATEIQANKLAEQMILQAKQKVADEIEKRLQRHSVPPLVNRFIFGPWKDVMNTIGVRDQCEGIAWSSATTFLDDIIWSVQPKLFSEDRKQLGMLIPRILPSLREGLALLDDNNFDLPAFLQGLQQLHLKALHVEKFHARSHPKNADANNSDAEDGTQHRREPAPVMDEFMEDIVLQGDKHDSFEFDINDPLLKRSKHFTAVKTMALGTWVDFDSAQGKTRGKLTWKCDFTGEYTFMNRMYKVVADLGMRELINRMDTGSASIVEDTPLFDRAVNAIVNRMKNMTTGTASAGPAVN